MLVVPEWLIALVTTVVVVMIASSFLRAQPAPLQRVTNWILRVTMSTGTAGATLSSAAAASPSGAAASSSAFDDSRVHSAHGGVAAPVVSTLAIARGPVGAAFDAEADLTRCPRPAGIPTTVRPYRRTALFTEFTVPKGLLRDHTTRPGVWGLIHVQEGQLVYRVTDPRRAASSTILSPESDAGLIEPTILHHVEPMGAVRFFVEFNKEGGTENPTATIAI